MASLPKVRRDGMSTCALQTATSHAHLVEVGAVKHNRGGGSVDEGGDAARHAAINHILRGGRRWKERRIDTGTSKLLELVDQQPKLSSTAAAVLLLRPDGCAAACLQHS